MTAKEVLAKARELIVNVGWCQGAYRRYVAAEGQKVAKVCAYCPIGALSDVRSDPDLRDDARRLLAHAAGVPPLDIIGWNDASGRTVDEVLAAFDKALEMPDN